MTKKEFINRIDKVIKKTNNYNWSYTCWNMYEHFPTDFIKKYYKKYIRTFLTKPNELISVEYKDTRYTYKTIRIFLLTSFREECLRTGIYKDIY